MDTDSGEPRDVAETKDGLRDPPIVPAGSRGHYGNERMAYAQMKRQQREAILARRAQRVASGDHPIRVAISNRLINIGEHLSKEPKPMPSTAIDVAHT